MFEGLFSPWHLVIIAFFVFMIFGPRRIADRAKQAGKKIQQLTDGETQLKPGEREVSRTGFYRFARMFRRRRP
jgi:Sec-independent protein translocase protein TatA